MYQVARSWRAYCSQSPPCGRVDCNNNASRQEQREQRWRQCRRCRQGREGKKYGWICCRAQKIYLFLFHVDGGGQKTFVPAEAIKKDGRGNEEPLAHPPEESAAKDVSDVVSAKEDAVATKEVAAKAIADIAVTASQMQLPAATPTLTVNKQQMYVCRSYAVAETMLLHDYSRFWVGAGAICDLNRLKLDDELVSWLRLQQQPPVFTIVAATHVNDIDCCVLQAAAILTEQEENKKLERKETKKEKPDGDEWDDDSDVLVPSTFIVDAGCDKNEECDVLIRYKTEEDADYFASIKEQRRGVFGDGKNTKRVSSPYSSAFVNRNEILMIIQRDQVQHVHTTNRRCAPCLAPCYFFFVIHPSWDLLATIVKWIFLSYIQKKKKEDIIFFYTAAHCIVIDRGRRFSGLNFPRFVLMRCDSTTMRFLSALVLIAFIAALASCAFASVCALNLWRRCGWEVQCMCADVLARGDM
jgi:hypothetical protein